MLVLTEGVLLSVPGLTMGAEGGRGNLSRYDELRAPDVTNVHNLWGLRICTVIPRGPDQSLLETNVS